MIEISIGLGIILSLVLSEALGVTAGGIIVPGYIFLRSACSGCVYFLGCDIGLADYKRIKQGHVFIWKKKNSAGTHSWIFVWIFIKDNICRHREHKKCSGYWEYNTRPDCKLDGSAGCGQDSVCSLTYSGHS